jgi:hypothetical protein
MGGDRSHLDGDLDRRPRTISLIDLMALVAGVAVVLPFNDILGNSWISAARVSEPSATFIRVGGFTSAAGVALATVVLVRHLRTGGNFRPAEWLLIANAMRAVHWKLAFAGGMDWAARSFGWVSQAGRFRAWYTLGMIGFLIVVAALSATRRPSYLRTRLPLLFCLPLFALWGPAILFSSELEVLWKAMWPSVPYRSLTRAAYLGLMQSPEHLLVCLPFVASIRDLARRDRPAWTWGEWAGFGIALVTAVGGLIQIIAAHMRNFPQLPERLAHLSVSVGWWLAELAMAWIAVRYLGWLWDNWISPPTSPSPSTSPV